MFLMVGLRADTNKEDYPLYLTEINERTILEQQIEYVKEIQPQQLLFCMKESEIKQFHTASVVKQIDPRAAVIPIMAQTKGAVCSALLGAQYIDNDEELILMAIDDFMDENSAAIIIEFRNANADAGVVSFNSVHPRYSFVETDEAGVPVEFAEKTPISKNALVSFYYFRRGRDFVECAKEVIRKDSPVNGRFYISQTLNEMILKQKRIVMRKITNDKFHPLKTETQMAEYITELNDKRHSK
jgi:NDP-sugar pyrophosphorylase family protein